MRKTGFIEPQILAGLREAEGGGAVSRARDQRCELLHVACELWRHERFHVDPDDGIGRRAPAAQTHGLWTSPCRRTCSGRPLEERGSCWKNNTRPAQRQDEAARRHQFGTTGEGCGGRGKVDCIALACRRFAFSETCFRALRIVGGPVRPRSGCVGSCARWN